MRESGGIDQDEVHAFAARGMNPFDEFVFGVRLQVQQMMSRIAGSLLQILVDLRQRYCAIDTGLARAEHIQIRAVEDQKRCHEYSLLFCPINAFDSRGWGKEKLCPKRGLTVQSCLDRRKCRHYGWRLLQGSC